ncbi:MAG: ABC transporter permease subunit [Calditrichaeota bacterium]|nr:ABC transporter permease subunit [Calditrichota bacterium]
MRATLAIFQKEFKSFFYSPIAYVILALFTALTGVFFYLYLSSFVEASFMDTIRAQQYGMAPQKFNVNLMLIRPYFWNIALISLFTLPTITMRLYSEEKRLGTVELLYTTPITPTQIVLGKFLAGVAFYVVLLIPTMFFQSLLFIYGDPEFLPVLSGYIGLFFLGSAFISVGLFISTTTENQIIAAIGGFGLSLLLWVVGWGANFASSTIKSVLGYISIINHFEDFAQGVVDTSHIAYYLLFCFIGLYFSLKMVESVKWRA